MSPSKRFKSASALVTKGKLYSIADAVEILKKIPKTKFDETVELSCTFHVDTKKSDQMVRSSVVLPHGIGKTIKVLVFCESEKESEAKEAGADYIGSNDLADKILKENWLEFDCCIATPGMMKVVSKLGKFLGPRGLMPTPKTGTVTNNIAGAVKEAKTGKVEFRMDKFGCMAVGVGKVSFSKESLLENIETFLSALQATKPSSIKGDFIKSIYLSSTMSPSMRLKI